jgi:hypothetical protein
MIIKSRRLPASVCDLIFHWIERDESDIATAFLNGNNQEGLRLAQRLEALNAVWNKPTNATLAQHPIVIAELKYELEMESCSNTDSDTRRRFAAIKKVLS